jgi:hypothetical protein
MLTSQKSLSIACLLVLAAVIATSPLAWGQNPSGPSPMLLATTGACNNLTPGGPCTQQSTLVQLDPATGQLLHMIGPVGYTVNGLAWDPKSETLYATSSVGDIVFHGLITIDPATGLGTPVDATVVNFGLPGAASPIHSITIGANGKIVGWYDEFAPPVGVTDTFVQIDKKTGIATEHPNTGIDTSQNGLAFDQGNNLWNIDSPKFNNGVTTQTAYLLNPVHGNPTFSRPLSPPTAAALGGFSPADGLYYGLNFVAFSHVRTTFLVTVDLSTGVVNTVGQAFDDVHVIAFTSGRQ